MTDRRQWPSHPGPRERIGERETAVSRRKNKTKKQQKRKSFGLPWTHLRSVPKVPAPPAV